MANMVTIDLHKLNEEDRRFLLNRNHSEILAHNQGKTSNVSIGFSILALAVSGFSLVYQTKIWWLVLIYSVFSIVGLIYFNINYQKAQKYLDYEKIRLKIDYEELFKYHLAYATKRIE